MDSLRLKCEFDYIYRNGFKKHCDYFSIYIENLNKIKHLRQFKGLLNRHRNLKNKDFINSDLLDFYIGLSVSKKVGKANKRNLIKRRARSIFASIERDLENISGYAAILVPRAKILELDFQELNNLIRNAFIKLQKQMSLKK